jgi:cell division septal protein FtsQ
VNARRERNRRRRRHLRANQRARVTLRPPRRLVFDKARWAWMGWLTISALVAWFIHNAGLF